MYILPGRYSVCGEGIWSSLSAGTRSFLLMQMYIEGLARHADQTMYLRILAMYQQ